jgi:transketolase C-terminal domain/subunit
MLARALSAWELINAERPFAVFNASCPLHLNKEGVETLKRYKKIFVLEDHYSATGLFATLCQLAATDKITCDITPFGVTGYAPSGSSKDLYKLLGLDAASVAEKIRSSC